MKLLVLGHKAFFPATDGGSIASLAMVKGFAQLGHKVTVLTMDTHKHQFDATPLPENLKQHVQWHTAKVNTRLNPIKLAVNLCLSKKPYNATRFESTRFSQKLQQLLESQTFDIIQLEGLYLSPYINLIRKYSQAQISLRAHNIESEIWQRQAAESTGFKRWYYSILAKRVQKMEYQALQTIDLLVPITQRDATILPFKNQKKVQVTPTGIEPEHCVAQAKQTLNQRLIYIGALDWQPNVQGLLWFVKSVWRNVAPNYPQWHFLVARRNAPKHLAGLLEKLNVGFAGQVNQAHQFMDNGDIMIVPLFSGSGMRIKIIEAMARGKCIVTTPVGAEGIPVINGQHLFIATTANEMTQLLETLMHNPDMVVKTGQNALMFARENFDNTLLVKQLTQFYQLHTT